MLQFEVDSAFSSRQGDFSDMEGAWNFIDFRDVLCSMSDEVYPSHTFETYLADKAIQESLSQSMSMGMPFEAVDLAERVELLNIYGNW